MKQVLLINNLNIVCCTNFFSIENVKVTFVNFIALNNKNLIIFSLDGSQVKVDQCCFKSNQVK